MWAPKRIDITTADLAAGLVGCFTPADHAREALIFEAELSSAKDLLVCTSVRSGFDALLTALRLPAGTEILFTAMTVADMPRIAKYHDLVPVPVDVDIDSMAPRVEALEEVVTSACRVLVLTHLFGGRIDFSTSISWARRRGMVVIEDCAEAYWDPAYLGDPRADVSLFSFGPIKHRTALGGAVVRITRADLLARVRRVIAEHPAQKSSQYAARLLKYGVLHKISARVSYAALLRMTRWFGVDHDRLVNDLTRGFGQNDFVRTIRQRPCLALIRMLRRRVQGTARPMEQREQRGRMLAAELGPSVICPGVASGPHSFWIFPVMSADPVSVLRALREAGFDATVGRSFALVEGHSGNGCRNAARVIEQAIYLPFYPQMPDSELLRMAQVVRQFESTIQSERLQTEVLPVADRTGSTPESQLSGDR